MTPTEIIAVKLFGWKSCDAYPGLEDRPYQWFMRSSLPPEINDVIGIEGHHMAFCRHSRRHWPNFADDLLKWYWIRRMEDALDERGMLREYSRAIHMAIPATQRGCISVDPIRATAEQRVAAALKVLEVIDQEKAKKAEQLERAEQRRQAVRAKAKELKETMRCNCDLDNWVPEDISGHSHVCRIHKAAVKVLEGVK